MIALPIIALGANASQPDTEPFSRFWNIRIGDVIMIAAIFLAPIFALWAQWKLQLRHEIRRQRMKIFSTLMATRLTALDVAHVQSLNLIDVVFSDKDEQDEQVRSAWSAYLAQLNLSRPTEQTQAQQWDTRREDLLATLLAKIGKPLGFDMDFTEYKSKAYHPSGLADNWNESTEIRKAFLAVMRGQPLKMDITSLPAQAPPPPPPAVNRR